MFGRAGILLTIAACAVAMPVAAQAPALTTTAFDGRYAGVSRTLEGSMGFATGKCSSQGGAGAPSLTIANGIARSAWGAPAEGSVSPQGVLVMRTTMGIHFDGQIDGKGTVIGRWNGACSYQVVWQRKAPGSTTAFDGEYIGVSRESSKTAATPGAECPPNGVPAPLTIMNGVVSSDKASWEGTVSLQGALAMQNQSATRVDGQIDSQGIIRGHGRNAVGCAITFVWSKQSR